jgi:hypothetical protein
LLAGTGLLAQEEKPPNLAAESLTLALHSLSTFFHKLSSEQMQHCSAQRVFGDKQPLLILAVIMLVASS